MPKPIQIQPLPNGDVIALCDDGSIWRITPGCPMWSRMPVIGRDR